MAGNQRRFCMRCAWESEDMSAKHVDCDPAKVIDRLFALNDARSHEHQNHVYKTNQRLEILEYRFKQWRRAFDALWMALIWLFWLTMWLVISSLCIRDFATHPLLPFDPRLIQAGIFGVLSTCGVRSVYREYRGCD